MVNMYQQRKMVNMYQQRTLGLRVPNLPQSNAPEQLAGAVQQNAMQMANEMATTADQIYQTDFEIASRKAISDIFSKNPNNPDALRKDFDAALKGLSKDASPDQQLELGMRFEMLAMPHISKAAENRVYLNTEKLKENHLTLMDLSLNDMEHGAADMLSDNPDVAFNAGRRVQNGRYTLENSLDMKDETGMPLFSAEQKVRLRSQAEQSIMFNGVKRWLEQQPDKGTAWQQIVDGQKKFRFYDANGNPELELDPRENMDLHSFDKLERYVETETRRLQSEVEDQSDLIRVQGAFTGDYFIDPHSKRDMKALDTIFVNEFLPSIEGMNPMEQGKATVDFVKKTGNVPYTLKSRLSATIRAGSPEQQVYAAAVISGIGNTKPQALSDIPENDKTYAYMLNSMISEGIEPEIAIERMSGTFNPANKAILDKRKEDLKALKNKGSLDAADELNKMFRDQASFRFWTRVPLSGAPNTTDRLITRFDSVYEEEYLLSGDQPTALQRTKQRLETYMGVSNIGGGGDRIIKYPPIKYYELEGLDNEAWLKEDFSQFAKVHLPGISEADIYLSDDEQTALEARDLRPTYPIIYKNKAGLLVPLIDREGREVRFAPNVLNAINKHNRKIEEMRKQRVVNQRIVQRIKEEAEQNPETMGQTIVEQALSEAVSTSAKAVSATYKKAKESKNKFQSRFEKLTGRVGALSEND